MGALVSTAEAAGPLLCLYCDLSHESRSLEGGTTGDTDTVVSGPSRAPMHGVYYFSCFEWLTSFWDFSFGVLNGHREGLAALHEKKEKSKPDDTKSIATTESDGICFSGVHRERLVRVCVRYVHFVQTNWPFSSTDCTSRTPFCASFPATLGE